MRRATRTTTALLYLVGSTDFHVRPGHPASYSNHSDHMIIIINIIMLMIIIFNMHNLFNGYQVNQNQALNFQVVTNISNSKF